MAKMNRLLSQSGAHHSNTSVHLDVYSRMTGASNVLHAPELATWNKDETLPHKASAYSDFTYVVVEDAQLHASNRQPIVAVSEWAGFRRNKPSLRINEIVRSLFVSDIRQAISSACLISPIVPSLRERLCIMQ